MPHWYATLFNRFRDPLTLVIGTGGAQMIAVLSAPILTRVFSPTEFGDFAVYTAVIAPLAVVLTLRLQQAVYLPEGPIRAFQIARASLEASTMGASILSVAALGLFAFGVDFGFGAIMLLIPLGAFALAAQEILQVLGIKLRQDLPVAKSNIARAGISLAAQLGLAGLRVPHALPLGTIVGVAASLPILFGKEPQALARQTRRASFRWILNHYRDYPLQNLPAALLQTLNVNAMPIAIAILFGPAAAGLYALGWRIVALPGNVLGTVVNQLSNRSFSERLERGRPIFAHANRLLWIQLAVYVPTFGGIGLLAPRVFTWIFGSDWTQAGQFAQILAITVGVRLIAVPLIAVFVAIRNQRSQLIVQLGVAVALIVPLILAFLTGAQVIELLMWHAIATTVVYIAAILGSLRAAYTADTRNLD